MSPTSLAQFLAHHRALHRNKRVYEKPSNSLWIELYCALHNQCHSTTPPPCRTVYNCLQILLIHCHRLVLKRIEKVGTRALLLRLPITDVRIETADELMTQNPRSSQHFTPVSESSITPKSSEQHPGQTPWI
jgi:hypothetical protein